MQVELHVEIQDGCRPAAPLSRMDRPFRPQFDTSHISFLAIAVPLEQFDALARKLLDLGAIK